MAVTVPHTAVNVDSRAEDFWGRQRIRVIEYTFDDEYATGGTALTPNEVGLSEIVFVAVSPDASTVEGYVVQYDYANEKLQVFVEEAVAAGGPLVEVANATDLSTFKVRLLIVGR